MLALRTPVGLLVRSLLLLAFLSGRAFADGQGVSDLQTRRIQYIQHVLDHLSPVHLLAQARKNQPVSADTEVLLLPGRSQKRSVMRKRQNGTDTLTASATTTATLPTTNPPPGTTRPTTTTSPPVITTTPPPTTTNASSAPTQAPPSTQGPGPTQQSSPTPQPRPGTTTTPQSPVILPPATSTPSSIAPPNGGSSNNGAASTTDVPPAPITSTDDQGNTITTAPAPAPTAGGGSPPDLTNAPSSFPGEIDAVTTDDQGQPITLSSVSFGEVVTTTDRGGRTFVTTYTPGGGQVSRLVLETTTLPNGERSTITSYASGATSTGAAAGPEGTKSAPAGLQTGNAAVPEFEVKNGCLVAVAAGLVGLAQLL